MRKNSVKNRRINDEVQRALSEILRELKDPRVSSLTSVMAVDVAPDLKTCKVLVSIYGSKEEIDNTMAGIRSANGFIRGELARRVNLRNTPELRFFADDSIAYGVSMAHRIDEVTAKDRAAQQERGEMDLSAYVTDPDEDSK